MLDKIKLFGVWLILLTAMLPYGFTLELNQPCTNPRGESGQCVKLEDCRSLQEIYLKTIMSLMEGEFFYGSRCSGMYNGKLLICCPNSAMLPRHPRDCGESSDDRIFGGTEASLGEFAWTALLVYNNSTLGEFERCGASLINARYAVTAAHCIETGWELTGVRLGEHNITNDGQDCDQQNLCADIPVEVGIEKVVVHPEYYQINSTRLNDIALIRFNQNVTFSDYIKPICLPIEDEFRQMNHTARTAFATGWGFTEYNKTSDVKLKVQLDVMDHQRCRKVYNGRSEIRSTQLCAGAREGKDTCAGDSGGPLMREIQGNYFLIGVTSFGPSRCGIKGVPGVYTNVAEFMDWIMSNLE